MTKRYKIHDESNLGISFVEGRLLTWGDSLVKAWPKGLEEECEELDCFGEVRCAVSTKHNDKIYVHVTSENVDTEAYEWPSLLEDKNYNLFRFTCDIGCISSLKTENGFQAVAGAADFKIKWKNTENETEVILEGHAAPILDVALDPRGELVASSSCDGDFRLWNIETKEFVFQKQLFTRCSDIEHAKCPATVEFQPKSGDLIAILSEKGALIYERSDKSLLHEIEDFSDTPKTLAWSRCGQALAIALKNTVRFYDAASFAKIHEVSSEEESLITSICFADRTVLIGEKSGTVISIPTSDFITKEMKKKQSLLPRPAIKMSSEESLGMSVDSDKGEERAKNGFVDEEAGEDDDDIDDLEALWEEDARSEGAPENTEAVNDDEDEMAMNLDDDSNNAISLNAIRDSVPLDKPKNDSDIDDDEEKEDRAGAFYS